jgi:hypothetical protein
MSETELNAMQQAVLEALGKEPDWVPIPREVIEDIRTQLHDGLADIAPRLTPENALWVSKHKLTTVHGCEANHLAGLTGFEWTLGNVKGTVLHKAVELGLNWRGVIVPADVVDEALAQLADDERQSAGPFIDNLPAGDREQHGVLCLKARRDTKCLTNASTSALAQTSRLALLAPRSLSI